MLYCVWRLFCALGLFLSLSTSGGRRCCPLVVWPLLPAQVVPCCAWFVAVGVLIGLVFASRKKKEPLVVPIVALAISLVSMFVFLKVIEPCSFFVLGLKARFANDPGYARMREYARDVQLNYDSIIEDPNKRDDLLSRYPFLDCFLGAGRFGVSDGVVYHEWGSALVGHWGFEVAPEGVAGEKGREFYLRVAPDIQFYFD